MPDAFLLLAVLFAGPPWRRAFSCATALAFPCRPAYYPLIFKTPELHEITYEQKRAAKESTLEHPRGGCLSPMPPDDRAQIDAAKSLGIGAFWRAHCALYGRGLDPIRPAKYSEDRLMTEPDQAVQTERSGERYARFFNLGADARLAGLDWDDNPYIGRHGDAKAWLDGWTDVDRFWESLVPPQLRRGLPRIKRAVARRESGNGHLQAS